MNLLNKRFEQSGMILLISLIMLLILSLVAVTAMRGTNLQEAMAGSMRDSQVSFQAAEAGLRQAEMLASEITELNEAEAGVIDELDMGGFLDYWVTTHDWEDDAIEVDADLGSLPAEAPRYVIEKLVVKRFDVADPTNPVPDPVIYRITSRAVGMNPNSVTILQTIYRRM